MGKDYYKILGIDKGASADEIKKAFREKAHKFHPDKPGGDEAKFKELNEAYQVLGDATKRSQYDQFGSTFEQAQRGGGFTGFDGFRDFSGFANGFNQGQNGNWQFDLNDLGDVFGDMFGFGSGRGGARKRRGNDIEVSLAVDFLEAVFGTEKEIALNKTVACDRCAGQGAEPGSKVETCNTCKGTGRVTRVQRTILGNIQSQTVCQTCEGSGKTYSQKCSKCRGAGITREVARLNVRIPAGINQNEAIRLSGQGEAGPKGAEAGDLYLKIRINPDKRFKRQDYDIISEQTIGFSQAALGDKIEIETVDGPVTLKIPEGTQSGRVFMLRGKGVPKLHSHGRGDHLVTIIVKIPIGLSRQQRKILEDLGI
jgi:molecular chaperone DnaJ